MENVIVMVDAINSHMYPSGYSYWSSDLNQTTRIAWSSNHVPYSVTLGTKGQMIPWLSTRVPPEDETAETTNQWFPLYTAFTVYLTTIDGQYLKTKNYRIWKEEESLRPTEVGTFTTPSFQLSYKGKKDFGISQILVKLFLKFFHLILRPPTLNGTGLNETFQRTNQVSLIVVARVGFEPTTPRLWALWATAALPHDI